MHGDGEDVCPDCDGEEEWWEIDVVWKRSVENEAEWIGDENYPEAAMEEQTEVD